MDKELSQKMRQARQGIARMQKIDSMLKQLEADRQMLADKARLMKEILDKEEDDAAKLENTSIVSIFYSALGSLEEHLEKEKKDVLAAKLKYRQAVKDLEDVEYEISALSLEHSSLTGCQKEYDSLYAEKKQQLIKEAGDTAKKILALTDNLSIAGARLKEIQEAKTAGGKVLESLEAVCNSLSSAESWGVWDFLGGGLITDIVKHSRIDDAKLEAENAQRLLREFKTELTDVSISSDIAIDTGGFLYFADFFFDGLIADWMMQKKINASLDSVSNVKEQVVQIMEKLNELETEEYDKIKRFETEMEELVNEAP